MALKSQQLFYHSKILHNMILLLLLLSCRSIITMVARCRSPWALMPPVEACAVQPTDPSCSSLLKVLRNRITFVLIYIYRTSFHQEIQHKEILTRKKVINTINAFNVRAFCIRSRKNVAMSYKQNMSCKQLWILFSHAVYEVTPKCRHAIENVVLTV